eukprot:216167_1
MAFLCDFSSSNFVKKNKKWAPYVAGGLAAGFAIKAASRWYAKRTTSLVLELNLNAVEILQSEPHSGFLQLLENKREISLRTIIEAIQHATKDPCVDVLLVKLGNRLSLMQTAMIQELREAIKNFNSAGKTSVAYAGMIEPAQGGNMAYYLASAFSKVYLSPAGYMCITGMSLESPFIRDMLDWLRVIPRVQRRKEYKSALDVLTEHEYTPACRETYEALVQSVARVMRADIEGEVVRRSGKGEEGDQDARDKWFESLFEGPHTAKAALSLGLVDELLHKDEVYAKVKEIVQKKKKKKISFLFLKRYAELKGSSYKDGKFGTIVYINAVGNIHRGKSNPEYEKPSIGSDTYCNLIRRAAKQKSTKAILLRVNSPGGDAVASDEIARELQMAKKKGIKIIASMANVAASGGYLISCPADRIVASPGCITGSIGVISAKLVTRAFWKERANVNWDDVRTNENSKMFSSLYDVDEEIQAKMDELIDQLYDDFVNRVSEARGLSIEQTEEVARGRVWTGADAKERGLVDDLGGFARAVEIAHEVVGVPKGKRMKVTSFAPPSFLQTILNPPMNDDQAMVSGGISGPLTGMRHVFGVCAMLNKLAQPLSKYSTQLETMVGQSNVPQMLETNVYVE